MYNFFCELWRLSVSYPSVGLEPTDGWSGFISWFKTVATCSVYPSVIRQSV